MGKLKKINMKMTSNTTPPPFKVKINNDQYSGQYYKWFDGDLVTVLRGPNYGFESYDCNYDLSITLDKSYLIKNIKLINAILYDGGSTKITEYENTFNPDQYYPRYGFYISADNGSNFITFDSKEKMDDGNVLYKFNNLINSNNLIIRFYHHRAGTPGMSEIELYAEIPDTLLKNLNNRFISINNENYQNDKYKILDSNDLNNLSDDLFYLNDLCKETEINNKKNVL